MTEATAGSTARPYELPEELLIDTGVARRIIAEFIRGHVGQAGFERVVLGLSGGLDSALVAYLVSEAIGSEGLLCLLMPYRTSSPESRADAEAVVARLGCTHRVLDISPIVDGYVEGALDGEDVGQGRRGNFAARARMAVLYDQSVVWRGLVVGTGNKTEGLLGYTTIFGDNASALNPIGDLYKSQVRQLAAEMGVPERILQKAPTADLWPGQTDEGELGLTYAQMDRLLYWMVDRRRSDEQLAEMGFDAASVLRVQSLIAGSEFKRQTPPVAKLTTRTPGVDYLYPRRRPQPRARG
jgi:NAD+ synthase